MSIRTRRSKGRTTHGAVGLLALIVVAFGLSVNGAPQSFAKRKITCKTPEIAASCYWAHGRLTFGNGNPTCRLWKIGTSRILGIYSGPESLSRDSAYTETTELPSNVNRAFKTDLTRVYADFEVCPLEPERAGVMQAACIESAKNIVVDP
jgi:hypothetical protein